MTPEELATIKAEISKPEYAGKGDAEIAEMTVNTRRPIKAKAAQREAMLRGYWGKIRLAFAAGSTAPDAVKALAMSAYDYFTDEDFDEFDIDLPAVQAMVSGLVAAGLMTDDDRKSLIALGDVRLPFSVVFGVDHLGIAQARAS